MLGADLPLLDYPHGAPVEGALRGMGRAGLAPAVPANGLLDTAAALDKSITSQAHVIELVQDRYRMGQFLVGGGLGIGEPVHRNHFDAVAPAVSDDTR